MPDIDIATLLKQRIAEAEDDLSRLRAALNAVENGNAEPQARPRARKAAPVVQLAVVPLGKIVDTLSQYEDGISTSALAEALGGDQTQIRELLVESEGDQVRRSGQRRATRWHVITDEDRVAARAAEIEARTKAEPKRSRRKLTTGAAPKNEPTPPLMDDLEAAEEAAA